MWLLIAFLNNDGDADDDGEDDVSGSKGWATRNNLLRSWWLADVIRSPSSGNEGELDIFSSTWSKK